MAGTVPDRGNHFVKNRVEGSLRIPKESLSDESVVAGCILGPVEEGGFHRCRHQARHGVRASGGSADEFLDPGPYLFVEAPERHLAFHPCTRLHVVHVIADRSESRFDGCPGSLVRPVSNDLCGFAQPVLALNDKPWPKSVADAAGGRVNREHHDRLRSLSVVRRQWMPEPFRVVGPVVPGSEFAHYDGVIHRREAATPVLRLFEPQSNASRHPPINLQRVDVTGGRVLATRLRVGCAGWNPPGKDPIAIVVRFRLDGACPNLLPALDVGPEPAPEGVAVLWMSGNDQRSHRAAAPQGCPMPGAARRGVAVQGEERHRGGRTAEHRGDASLHEQVRVVAQRLRARCVDQECSDFLAVGVIERVEVLQEPRTGTIEIEGVGER